MVQWHYKSKKKRSGGVRTTLRRSTKKLAWKGRGFTATGILTDEGKEERFNERVRGGKEKTKVRLARNAVVALEGGKSVKGKVLTTFGNPADRHYIRRNILTKGALIEVEAGKEKLKARVTSRPGQTGTVNAVALKKEEIGALEAEEKQKKPKKNKKERKKPEKEKEPPKGQEKKPEEGKI